MKHDYIERKFLAPKRALIFREKKEQSQNFSENRCTKLTVASVVLVAVVALLVLVGRLF